MLIFERLHSDTFPWAETHKGLADGTIYQSPPWLNFLKSTQNGDPVIAVLRNGSEDAGYFTGMIVRKFGFNVLGSPFPGWSTSYMGFNLRPGVSKHAALDALKRFVFGDLRCAHLELMDRKFTVREFSDCNLRFTSLNGFEVDLTATEQEIFDRFKPSCRQAIRKATRSGIAVEEACDSTFVDEYYAQLQEVFARQKLVPTYDKTRVEELVRHIQPTGKLLSLRARDAQGRCIATGVFLEISPTTMYFWGGASWWSQQSLRPNDLLMWTAMRIGKARGIKIMDLGGAGDYKKKFGGKPISVPWARISSQPLIGLLRETAKTVFSLKQKISYRTAYARSTPRVELPIRM